MTDTRTRQQKLAAMAGAVESPNEAAIARQKLATMGAAPPPPRPPAPPTITPPEPFYPAHGFSFSYTATVTAGSVGVNGPGGVFFFRITLT
jgi:hypothetical protein